MDIEQLIETAPTINITISGKDLNNFATGLIAKTRRELTVEVEREQAQTLLTINDVADKLKVDRATLYRWHDKNVLRMIDVGGARRYRLSDVVALIEQGKSNL